MSNIERAEGESTAAAAVTLEEESDILSDIDDTEVDSYLYNEEEKKFKKIIWEAIYKKYLEEQAAKEAALLTQQDCIDAEQSQSTTNKEDAR